MSGHVTCRLLSPSALPGHLCRHKQHPEHLSQALPAGGHSQALRLPIRVLGGGLVHPLLVGQPLSLSPHFLAMHSHILHSAAQSALGPDEEVCAPLFAHLPISWSTSLFFSTRCCRPPVSSRCTSSLSASVLFCCRRRWSYSRWVNCSGPASTLLYLAGPMSGRKEKLWRCFSAAWSWMFRLRSAS